jgi:hypothetical protein
LGVEFAGLHQIIMATAFDDAAALKNKDLVRVLNCRKAVSDDKRSAAGER